MDDAPLTGPAPTRTPIRPALIARPRFWISLAVTVLWLTVMTVVWLRESNRMGGSLRRMGISPEVLLVSWNDYDQWLWVEQNGRRLGVSQMSLALKPQRPAAPTSPKTEMPGYREQSRSRLAWRLLGFEVPFEIATRVDLNPAFEMETMQAVLLVAGRELLLQAFTENRQLYYRLKIGPAPGGENAASLAGAGALLADRDVCGAAPLGEPILLEDTVIPILTRTAALKPGQRWTTRAANLLDGVLPNEVQVKVEAEEIISAGADQIKVWRLTESLGGIRSTVWYDQRGRVVRRDLEGGPGSTVGHGLRFAAASSAEATRAYPGVEQPYPFAALDRDWIRQHLDPSLQGKPLSQALPQLPQL